MRGLAITNSPIIRPAHNSLARYVYVKYDSFVWLLRYIYRPADIRASLNNLIITTFNAEKRKAMEKKTGEVKPPPAKRAKTTPVVVKSRKGKGKEKDQNSDKDKEEETYHFIGYVPAYGKVWELDGLKSGPLEVGELSEDSSSTSSKDPNRGWMDVVRPALRMKMEKYGGSANDGSNIRFSLLAIVEKRKNCVRTQDGTWMGNIG
jgi:ubiquitin carboxyl-terminal hydrolase L5